MYEEHLARETMSLRKCAERCLLTLSDTRECRQQVQSAVLALSNEAAGAGLADLPSILKLDACYLGLGLVLQSGGDAHQLAGVLQTLRQHCSVAAATHTHLLRRRAAWLIGWILRTPYFSMLAMEGTDGAGSEAVRRAAPLPSRRVASPCRAPPLRATPPLSRAGGCHACSPELKPSSSRARAELKPPARCRPLDAARRWG